MDSTTDYLARLDEAVDSTGNLNEISAFEIWQAENHDSLHEVCGQASFQLSSDGHTLDILRKPSVCFGKWQLSTKKLVLSFMQRRVAWTCSIPGQQASENQIPSKWFRDIQRRTYGGFLK
jgi:hypothetical protein